MMKFISSPKLSFVSPKAFDGQKFEYKFYKEIIPQITRIKRPFRYNQNVFCNCGKIHTLSLWPPQFKSPIVI